MDPSYARFFRPALRAGGLALLLLFLIGLLFDGLPPLADPQARVLWVSGFLGQSLWLVVALLFLLLSLGEYWASEPLPQGAPRPGRRDGLLMRLRPLLLVLAILYLVLIPFTLFTYNTIRLRGNQAIEAELNRAKADLQQIRADLDRSPGPLPSPELLARYPFLTRQGEPVRPLTYLKERLRNIELSTTLASRRKREDAEKDLQRRNLRVVLAALIHAATLHYFWRYWPRYPAALPALPYEDQLDAP